MIHKILNENTGLFATGKRWASTAWSKTGKTYKQSHYVKTAAQQILEQYDYQTKTLHMKVGYDRPRLAILSYELVCVETEELE